MDIKKEEKIKLYPQNDSDSYFSMMHLCHEANSIEKIRDVIIKYFEYGGISKDAMEAIFNNDSEKLITIITDIFKDKNKYSMLRFNMLFDAFIENVLNSGKAPQEWIDAINKEMEETGRPPVFAIDYCRNILNSEKAPKSWLKSIADRIEKDDCDCYNFAFEYCEKNAHLFIKAIKNYIKKHKDAPDFAVKYCKENVHLFADVINYIIEDEGWRTCPDFARDYCKQILDSGKAPQEWLDSIDKRFEDRGDCSIFAIDYCKKILDDGKAPTEWICGIINHKKKYGYVPNIANDWYKKRELENKSKGKNKRSVKMDPKD